MGDIMKFPRPINWKKLRSDEAEQLIRERAARGRTGGVIFTDHAWDRVDERDITREDVFRILREGFCQTPEKNEEGEWQVIVTKRVKGQREAGAVTIILEDDEKLIIRTVEWMDLK